MNRPIRAPAALRPERNMPKLSNTSATLAIKRVRTWFTGKIPLRAKRLSYKPLIGIIADNL